MDKYYTTFQVAKMCHASPASVIRWIHENKIPASITAGGHHRIHSKDIAQLLKKLRMPIPEELMTACNKFLIISENRSLLQSIRKILNSKFSELKIEEAEDYFMAGWKASRLRPDLVILDLRLPDMEIFKIGELMRAFFEYKSTPILALLSSPSAAVQKKIHALGLSDWLTKPFTREAFLKKIQFMLGKNYQLEMTGT